MIGGATRGKGGWRLGAHLSDRKHENDATIPGESRGLIETGTKEQIKELTNIGKFSSHSKPLYHVHADPSITYNSEQWGQYWKDFEKEFKLDKQPFSEVTHIKHGREHIHRVYSLVKSDGSCIRMDNDFVRREKLNRLAELKNGEEITKGKHNKSVVETLKKEGKIAEVQAIEASGITQGNRSKAKLTPIERAQQERTGINRSVISRIVRDAYNEHKGNSFAFRDSLKNAGLILANGDKSPVIIDLSGNVHSLNRLINQQNKKDNINIVTMKSKDAFDFVKELNLKTYKQEKNNDTRKTEKTEQSTTNNSPEYTQSLKRDGEKNGDDIGISGTARESRRKSSHDNFAGNTRQSNSNDGNDERLAKEINNQILLQMKKLQIELKK